VSQQQPQALHHLRGVQTKLDDYSELIKLTEINVRLKAAPDHLAAHALEPDDYNVRFSYIVIVLIMSHRVQTCRITSTHY